MTFTAVDSTADHGQPYELFEITVPGSAQAWYFTTETEARTYASHTYSPEAIARGEIVREAGAIGSGISITVPDTNDLALTLLAGLTTDVVNITIRQFHRSDSEARVVFIGTVSGVQFSGATATITAGPRNTLASKRKVLWLTYQASCNWAWGEDTCGVNRDDFRTDASLGVSAQTGRVLTVPALSGAASGDYNGGIVERVATNERRFIASQVAGALTLSHPFAGLTSTVETFHIFPGCRNTEADCLTRFSNLDNYLGFAHLPDINPYRRSAYYLSSTAEIPDPGDVYEIPGFAGYKLSLFDKTVSIGFPRNRNVDGLANLRGWIYHTITVLPDGRVSLKSFRASSESSTSFTIFVTDYWVIPLPIPDTLPNLFEINVSLPLYSGSPVTTPISGITGQYDFDTWLPLNVTSLLSYRFENTGVIPPQITTNISIREVSTGLVRVAGTLTITNTIGD